MKTTSLELSKQLKEAGYPQEGAMWWSAWSDHGTAEQSNCHELHWELTDEDGGNIAPRVASPTADEILGQLPCATQQEWFLVSKNPSKEEWVIDWNTKNEMFKGESLADTAAKMWLYLKKNNML